MNYEKKYKEALERAREQYNKRTPLYDIEYIFPELKESEYERIMEELCDFLRDNMLYQDAQYFISWLERQGEQKSFPKQLDADKVIEWLYDHLYTRRDEQSPANHFVCSKQEMLTRTEFVEQFKKDFEL